MKDALDKILKILDKQIDDLGDKSAKTRLDEKEIDALGSLARTYVLVMNSGKKPRGRPFTKGHRMSEEDLVKRASDDTNPTG